MSKRFESQYYGIVFGFRQHVDNISDLLILENGQLIAPKDHQHSWLFEKIAGVYNKLENALITYHDGVQDKSCEYNGRHYHLVCELRGHPTRDQRWGRDCLAWAKARPAVAFFAAATAANVASLSRHICQAPRKVIHSKGEKLIQDIGFTPKEGTSIEPMANARANLKRDTNYYRIDFLTRLMERYRTSDMPTIKRQCLKNPAEWEEFVECLSGSSFDIHYKKAADIYRTKQCSKKISELILEEPQTEWNRPPYLSKQQSLEIFDKWLKQQNFDKSQFLDDLYKVLERKLPKINTFVLHGPPNSGKSFILRSLIPHYSYFGEVRGGGSNYTFLWQDCIDTGLIFIEEPMISPEVAEQFKLVMEGAATHVHVKMRGDAILQPTPVLITTNSLPWRWCSSEAGAFQARMKMYTCQESPFLKEIKGQLNPLIWCDLFKKKESDEIEELTSAFINDDSTIIIVSSDDECTDDDESLLQAIQPLNTTTIERPSCIAWAPATPTITQLIDGALSTPANSPETQNIRWWEHDNSQNQDIELSSENWKTITEKRTAEENLESTPKRTPPKDQWSPDNLFLEVFGVNSYEQLSHYCNVCGAVHLPPETCPILTACVNSSLVDMFNDADDECEDVEQ